MWGGWGTQAGSGRCHDRGQRARGSPSKAGPEANLDLWRDAGQHPVRSQAAALRSQPRDLGRALDSSIPPSLPPREEDSTRVASGTTRGTLRVCPWGSGWQTVQAVLVGAQVPEGGSGQACSEQATSIWDTTLQRPVLQMVRELEACGLTEETGSGRIPCFLQNVGLGTRARAQGRPWAPFPCTPHPLRHPVLRATP